MTTTQKGSAMRAWHNDPALKAEVLARMLQHRVEDSIIQGSYQEYAPEVASQYRGCLIGCTLPLGTVTVLSNRDSFCYDGPCEACSPPFEEWTEIEEVDWHPMVEELYGISQSVNKLWERIFEWLPAEKAPWFAVATIEATPVGADMDLVEMRLEQEMRAHFKNYRPIPLVVYGSKLVQLLSRHVDLDDDDRENVLWMAETVIRVLKECDPNPVVPFETVADTKEDTRVPVA